jgi:hypothetical protein
MNRSASPTRSLPDPPNIVSYLRQRMRERAVTVDRRSVWQKQHHNQKADAERARMLASALRPWDFGAIVLDQSQWMTPTDPVYLCLRVSVERIERLEAAGGAGAFGASGSNFVCVRNISASGVDPPVRMRAPSGARRRAPRRPKPTKRATSMKAIAYLRCPPVRNWRVDERQKTCAARRTVAKRLQAMLAEAHRFDLAMIVNECVLRRGADGGIYDPFIDHVQQSPRPAARCISVAQFDAPD